MRLQIVGVEPAQVQDSKDEVFTVQFAAVMTKEQFKGLIDSQKEWGIDAKLQMK